MKKIVKTYFWKRIVASLLTVVMLLTAAEWDNIVELFAATSNPEVVETVGDYTRLNYYFNLTIPLSGYDVVDEMGEADTVLDALRSKVKIQTLPLSGGGTAIEYINNSDVGNGRKVEFSLSADKDALIISNLPVWVQKDTQGKVPYKKNPDGTLMLDGAGKPIPEANEDGSYGNGTYEIPTGFYKVSMDIAENSNQEQVLNRYVLTNTEQNALVVMDAVNKTWSARCASPLTFTMEQDYEQLAYTFDVVINTKGYPATEPAKYIGSAYLAALNSATVTTKPINKDKANSAKTYHIGDKFKVGGVDTEITLDVASNKITIKNIPVWINKGTGDQTQNGDGSFVTEAGFYTVSLPEKADIYQISNSEQAFRPAMDVNERKWSVTCASTMEFSKRTAAELTTKDIPVTWLTKDVEALNDYYSTYTDEEKGKTTYRLYYDTWEANGFRYTQYRYDKSISVDPVNTNMWTLTYPSLVKDLYEQGEYTCMIARPEGYNVYVNGNRVGYSFLSLRDLENIVYSQQTTVNGKLDWYDSENKTNRPEVSAVEENLALFYHDKDGEQEVPKETYTITWDTATNEDQWSYSICGLDMYDADINLIHYYVRIKNTEISGNYGKDLIPAKDTSEYYYNVTYDNKDNSTDSTLAYDGATIHAALYNVDRIFSVNVKWMDDATGLTAESVGDAKYDSAMQARRDEGEKQYITLYLWRETNESVGAAAVCDESGKQYVCSLSYVASGDSDVQVVDFSSFGIADSKKMPLYDEQGKAYKYYFTADLADESEYKIGYPEDSRNVYNGKTIKLIRSKLINISGQKVWKASGQNDFRENKVTLVLQNKLSDGSWETIAEKEVGPATPAKTVLEHIFTGVEQYDADGKVYEYRLVEPQIGTVSLDWTDASESISGNSQKSYKIGNNSYCATLSLDGANHADGSYAGGTYTVTNRLSENLNYVLKVTWPEYAGSWDLEDAGYLAYLDALDLTKENIPSATYLIYQNGVEVAKVTFEKKEAELCAQVTYKKDGVYQLPSDLVVTSSSYAKSFGEESVSRDFWKNWQMSGIVLPAYDEEGNRYSYTVTEPASTCSVEREVAAAGTDVKCWEEIYYDNSLASKTETATIEHRISHTTSGTTLTIEKKWNDNVTAYADREVETHIVLLQKNKNDADNYEYVVDLGTELGGNYKQTLNASNGFKSIVGVSTIADVESLGGVTLDKTTYEYAYGVIEYSISVGLHTTITLQNAEGKYDYTQISFIKNGDAYSFDAESKVKYDTVIEDGKTSYKLLVDSYKMSVKKSGNYFTITNTIQQKAHIYLNTEWNDASNVSGYRNEVYIAELYEEGNPSPVDTKILYTEEQTEGGSYKNNYQIDFGVRDLYDRDGNRTNYTVKQYVADAELNRKQITTFDTQFTTKTNYTMELEIGDVVGTLENGEFLYEQRFAIANRAQNINYSTQFYLLWHDEAAYNAGARPDLEYKLYEQLPGGELKECTGDYTAITLPADETNASNPYFQKIVISGLDEYGEVDGNLQKYEYFLKPTLKTVPQYSFQSAFYESIQKDDGSLLIHNAPYPVEGKTYYQKDIDAGVIKVTSLDKIPEHGAVLATLSGTVKISGSKTWTNLRPGMPASSYPYCEVYLYMSSQYDKNYQMPASEEGLGNYVAVTSLDEKSGYKKYYFYEEGSPADSPVEKTFPKYDSYGTVYEYHIREGIYTSNDSKNKVIVKREIITGAPTNGMNLVNTFDPNDSNKRTIRVEKYWDKAGATYKPTAKFTLYRMEWQKEWCAADASQRGMDVSAVDYSKMSDITAKYLSDEAAKSEDTAKVTKILDFTIAYSDKTNGYGFFDIRGLSIYSPANTPYVYFVVENTGYVPSYVVSAVEAKGEIAETTGILTPLTDLAGRRTAGAQNCEATAIANNVILVGNDNVSFGAEDGTQSINSVAFLNKYKEQTFNYITGTISWAKGAYADISKTPEFSDIADNTPSDYFNVVVVRYADTQSDLAVQNDDKTVVYSSFASGDKKVKVEWTENSAGNNVWDYKISLDNDGTFAQCSENGNYYKYNVYCLFKNAQKDGVTGQEYNDMSSSHAKGKWAAINYSRTYVDPVSASDMTIVETDKHALAMKTVNYNLKGTFSVMKVWKDGYNSYGLRPKSVTVAIQYLDKTDSDSANWKWKNVKRVKEDGTKEDVTIELTSAGGWKNASFTKFPISYEDTSLTAYEYRAVEIKIGGIACTLQDTDGNYGYDAVDKSGKTYYQTREDYLKGLETGVVSPINDTKDNPVYTHRGTKRIGSYYAYQPLSVTTLKDGNYQTSLSTTIYNAMESNTTTQLTVTKVWEEPGTDASNGLVKVRPTTTIILQKRVMGAADDAWQTICKDGTTEPYTWNITGKDTAKEWTLTLKNLPVYVIDGDEMKVMEYRALEVGTTYAMDTNAQGEEVINITARNVPIERTVALTADGSGVDFSKGEQISGCSHSPYDALSIPFVGSYVLTGYEEGQEKIGEDVGLDESSIIIYKYSTKLTNSLIYKEVSVTKEWEVGTGMDGITAELMISSGDSYYTELKGERTFVPKTGTWTSTYTKGKQREIYTWMVPVFTDRHEATQWTVSETKVLDGKVAYDYKDALDASTQPYTLKDETKTKEYEKIGVATSGLTTVDTTADDQEWLVKIKQPAEGATKEEWVVSNMPLTSHQLIADYQKDTSFATDTRPITSKVALQYRLINESDGLAGDWTNLDEEYVKGWLSTADIPEKVRNDAQASSYSIDYTKLPLYKKDTDDIFKKCQYRVVETEEQYVTNGTYTVVNYIPQPGQADGISLADDLTIYKLNDSTGSAESSLDVDREVGGYTYLYDNTTAGTTKLTKNLLTTNLSGEKIWADEDDKYETRAKFAATDASALVESGTVKYMKNTLSPVQVEIKKISGGTTTVVKGKDDQPIANQVVWKLDSTKPNIWSYTTSLDCADPAFAARTEGLLLKYEAKSDALISYVVTEKTTDAFSGKQYTVEYGESLSATYAAIQSSSDAGHVDMFDTVMGDITNRLKMIPKLTVKKTWNDVAYDESSFILKDGKLGYKPYKVTVKLQRKIATDTDFTDVTELRDVAGTPTPTVITATLDSMNVSVSMLTGDLLVSQESFTNLPSCDSNGKPYTYRFVETDVEVVFKNASGNFDTSDTPYVKSLQPKAGILTGLTKKADGTYQYEIGPYVCDVLAMVNNETDGDVYELKNTPIFATAEADVTWKEYKAGKTEVDPTLKENFRPTGVTLKLQQQATTADDTLAETASPSKTISYEASLDGTSGLTITEEPNHLSDTKAITATSKLPIMGLDTSKNLVTYEYRILEENFAYKYSSYSGVSCENLTYYKGANTSSDVATGATDTPWANAVASSAFYVGTNASAKKTGTETHVYAYKTTIINTLNLTEIAKLTCELSGTITWKDKENAPEYRPDALSLSVKGSYNAIEKTTIAADTIVWEYENTDADPAQGSKWDYKVEVPIYSADGDYLTYSVTQTKPDHYLTPYVKIVGENTATETHIIIHETQTASDYYYKQSIKDMNFVEEAEAKLYVVKEWDKPSDASEIGVIPEQLLLKLQRRTVTRNTDGTLATVVSEWADLPTDMVDTLFATKVTSNHLLVLKADSATSANLHATTTDDSTTTKEQWMSVFDGLSLFDASDNWYEYRVLEDATKHTGAVSTDVFIGSGADQTIDLSHYISSGDVERLDSVPHVGGYLLTDYDHNIIGKETDFAKSMRAESTYSRPVYEDNQSKTVGLYGDSISFLTNTLDVRKNVMVKKEWNVENPSDHDSDTVKVELVCIKNGKAISLDTASTKVTLNKGNSWSYEWKNLPTFDETETPVSWSVREIEVNGSAVDNAYLTNKQTALDVDVEAMESFAGLSADHQWKVTYRKAAEQIAAEDKRITEMVYTITNTPLTSHGINITYTDDFSNAYKTRAENTQAVLQYRYLTHKADVMDPADSDVYTDWIVVDDTDLKVYPLLLQDRAGTVDSYAYTKDTANITLDNTNSGNPAASYSGSHDCLPKDWVESVTESGVTSLLYHELEYRYLIISEEFTGAVTLPVTYDSTKGGSAAVSNELTLTELGSIDGVSTFASDRAVAGYTYAYADALVASPGDLTTTYVTKALLKNTLEGDKVWSDESNLFALRPALSGAGGYVDGTTEVDNTSANIQIKVYCTAENGSFTASTDALNVIDGGFIIKWKTNGSDRNASGYNKWHYVTTEVPRYRAAANKLASYAVEESVTDAHYNTVYAQGTNAGIASYNGSGVAIMSDITNALKTTKVAGQKIWDNTVVNYKETLGLSIISSTLALQKMEADGTWNTVKTIAPDGTETYLTHTFVASDANKDAPNTEPGNWNAYEFIQVPQLLTGEAYRVIEEAVEVHFSKDGAAGNQTYTYDITSPTTAEPQSALECFTITYENTATTAGGKLCAAGDNTQGYLMKVKNSPALCTLVGEVEWVDGDDTLGLRPSVEDMMTSLKLVSTANGNSVETSFKDLPVTWENTGADSNIWTYTIMGIANADGDGYTYTYTITQDAFGSTDAFENDGIIHIYPLDEDGVPKKTETVYRGDVYVTSGIETANVFSGYRFVETLRTDAMIRAAVENVTTDPHTGRKTDKGWGGYVKMESGNIIGGFFVSEAEQDAAGGDPAPGDGSDGGEENPEEQTPDYHEVISEMTDKYEQVEIEEVKPDNNHAVRATWIAAQQPGYDWKYIQKISIHYLTFEAGNFIWYTFRDLPIDLVDTDDDGLVDTAEPVYDAERNLWGLDAPALLSDGGFMGGFKSATIDGIDPAAGTTVKSVFGSFKLDYDTTTNVVSLILNSDGDTQLPIAVQIDVEFITTKIPAIASPEDDSYTPASDEGDNTVIEDNTEDSVSSKDTTKKKKKKKKDSNKKDTDKKDKKDNDKKDPDDESDSSSDKNQNSDTDDVTADKEDVSSDKTDNTTRAEDSDDVTSTDTDDVKTSDDAHVIWWMTLLGLGISLIAASTRRKKKYEKK